MNRKDEVLSYIWDFYEKVYEINNYDIDYLHNLLHALEDTIRTEVLLELTTENVDDILQDEEELIVEEEWEV